MTGDVGLTAFSASIGEEDNKEEVAKILISGGIPIRPRNGRRCFVVPGPKELRELLLDEGVDADVLETPLQAWLNGEICAIKNNWIGPPRVCNCHGDGCKKFEIMWSGRHPKSDACSHALTRSAVYFVCFRLVLFMFMVFVVQVEQQYNITLPANSDPVAESVSRTDNGFFLVHFSHGAVSDPMPLSKLRGRARQLAELLRADSAANSVGADLNTHWDAPLQTRKRGSSTVNGSGSSTGRGRKHNQKNGRKRTLSDAHDKRKRRKHQKDAALVDDPALDQAPTVPAAKVQKPKMLRLFGHAGDAQKLQESIDNDWQRELDDNKERVAAFPEKPSSQRIRLTL